MVKENLPAKPHHKPTTTRTR